ncbi:FadR/GntR family transcriptional regulator [Clostridiaceae bacterium M8S5]|nr:FadR/GntR family transcriptional regulator [Clostridiaceae bacterium M8S5]
MFKPIKQKKVYQHVIEQIQNMILSGELKKGDKLPAERELSSKLDVSRSSIREALRALEILGLIESRQGEGNFISDNIGNSFFEPLSVMFMLNEGKKEEILELRKMIEVETAAMAATKISEEDINVLKDLMVKLKNARDEKESANLDKELHYKITQIAGNSFAFNLLNSITFIMESFIENAREAILKNAKERDLLIDQHQEICDALIEKNPRKASLAMRKHLDEINKFIMY